MRPLPALGLPFHCLPLACLFTAFPWPAVSLPFLDLPPPFHCLQVQPGGAAPSGLRRGAGGGGGRRGGWGGWRGWLLQRGLGGFGWLPSSSCGWRCGWWRWRRGQPTPDASRPGAGGAGDCRRDVVTVPVLIQHSPHPMRSISHYPGWACWQCSPVLCCSVLCAATPTGAM